MSFDGYVVTVTKCSLIFHYFLGKIKSCDCVVLVFGHLTVPLLVPVRVVRALMVPRCKTRPEKAASTFQVSLLSSHCS